MPPNLQERYSGATPPPTGPTCRPELIVLGREWPATRSSFVPLFARRRNRLHAHPALELGEIDGQDRGRPDRDELQEGVDAGDHEPVVEDADDEGPITVPMIEPSPPLSGVPPITTAAIAVSR